MIHESENLPNSELTSPKKSYSAMKISKLGSLTELTQANAMSTYNDGMMMAMMA